MEGTLHHGIYSHLLLAPESRKMLIDKFASTRQRNNMTRRLENRIKDEYLVGMSDRVGETLQSIQENTDETAQNRRDLPIFNLHAKKTRHIYDISSIVSGRDFNLIKDSGQFFNYVTNENAFKELPSKYVLLPVVHLSHIRFPDFIKTRLSELYHKTDLEKSDLERSCARLQYLASMIGLSPTSVIVHN